MTYDETHTMSCESNGYPAATIELSATDVTENLQKAKKAGSSVSVSCTAKNKYNTKPVVESAELKPSCKFSIIFYHHSHN